MVNQPLQRPGSCFMPDIDFRFLWGYCPRYERRKSHPSI